MLKLQFRDNRKPAIWLVDSRYSIGRDSNNDIIIDESGISGFHAELYVEDDDRIFLTDAGSVGGTHVNDQKIKARTQLRAGDLIGIGEVQLELVDPKAQFQQQGAEAAATAISPALQGLEAEAASPAGEAGWELTARTGSLAGKSYPLSGSRVVIGRSKDCDVVLPSNHVSRQHAELYFHRGELWVKDLGSANGTYLNRKKVSEQAIADGDELRFDTLVFEVSGPGSPADGGNEPASAEDAQATSFRPALSASEGAQPSSAPGQQSTVADGSSSGEGSAAGEPVSAMASSGGGAAAEPRSGGGGNATLLAIGVVVVLAAAAGAWWWLA